MDISNNNNNNTGTSSLEHSVCLSVSHNKHRHSSALAALLRLFLGFFTSRYLEPLIWVPLFLSRFLRFAST